MRILYCGDVMGRSGRDIVTSELPKLRERLLREQPFDHQELATSGA